MVADPKLLVGGVGTALAVAAGFSVGAPVVAAILGGVGINWLSDLTGTLAARGGRWLFDERGELNHDLRRALSRAFRNALTQIESEWQRSAERAELAISLGSAQEAALIERTAPAVFRDLRDRADEFFGADAPATSLESGEPAAQVEVLALAGQDQAAARRILSERLTAVLRYQSPLLVEFTVERLGPALAFFFAEELKAPSDQGTRAWRAFQRLLTEQLAAGVRDLGRGQAQLQQDVQRLQATIEALSADALFGETRAALLDAIARGSEETRVALEQGIERILRLLREELAATRREMLPVLEERGLVQGHTSLSVDLRRRFDDLLEREDAYGLFAGRAEELRQVRAFLDGPGGYLLVSGPSGIGKTALMAELARRLDAAYHFISRAYGTADEDRFFRSLCQQIAARQGLGGRLPDSTTELAELFRALLQMPAADGRPSIVLIDGLDEALGWEPGVSLLPRDLPDGVKVIFAARQIADTEWPERLGLADRIEVLPLGRLQRDDLSELLRAAGGPAAALAEDADWIERALRVTHGDPFYVRLLVEDLRDGRLPPQEIERAPAGLDAYLRGWWDQVARELRAEEVRDLLGTLTAARGPLPRAELIAVVPSLAWTLDAAVADVRRFVAGNERDGYAVGHARFAEYVRRRVGAAIGQYDEALVRYCAGWREHQGRYALSYYAGHLADAGRWDDLHALVAGGEHWHAFAEARHVADGSYAGYLADLRLAWDHAGAVSGSDSTTLGRQVRYALIETSTRALAGNIPSRLLAALVSKGVWTLDAALAYARRMPEPGRALEALITLATVLDQDAARPLIREALESVAANASEPDVAAKLVALAPMVPADLVDRLVEVAMRGEDVRLRCRALVAIAPYLPDDHRSAVIAWVLAHVRAVDDWTRGAIFRGLAPYLTDADVTVALEIIRETGADAGADAITALAGRLPPADRTTWLAQAAEINRTSLKNWLAPDAHDEAVRQRQGILMPGQRPVALADAIDSARRILIAQGRPDASLEEVLPLAPGMLEGMLDEALDEVDPIRFLDPSMEPLAYLARWLPDTLRFHALRRIAQMPDSPAKGHVLAAVAPHLPESALVEAHTIAIAIADPGGRAEAIAMLAPRLPVSAQRAAMVEALAAAGIGGTPDGAPEQSSPDPETDLRPLESAGCRAQALILLAESLPADLLGEALAATRSLSSNEHWKRALDALAPRLDGPLLQQALASVRAISDGNAVLIAKANLSRAAGARDQAHPLVEDALATARAVRDPTLRVRLLTTLLPVLSGEQRDPVLAAALAAARAIPSSDVPQAMAEAVRILPAEIRTEIIGGAMKVAREVAHAHYLALLAPFVPAGERGVLLREAFLPIRAITDGYDRVCALFALAGVLPPGLHAEAVAFAKRRRHPGGRMLLLALLADGLRYTDRADLLAGVPPAFAELERDPAQEQVWLAIARLLPQMPAARQESAALRLLDVVRRGAADAPTEAEEVAALLPYLPLQQRAAMVGAIAAAADKYGEPAYRVLSALAAVWKELPEPDRQLLWLPLLRGRSQRARFWLINDLAALAPAIGADAGAEGIAAAYEAISDITDRWP